MSAPATSQPVSDERLKQIATDVCTSTLDGVEGYHHDKTAEWNNGIINNLLKALIAETTPEGKTSPYKFAVNSTIIQHFNAPEASDASTGKYGRRGMHSAAGAYWNSEKDGMWSFKYDGAEKKGMDVVLSVYWIGI